MRDPKAYVVALSLAGLVGCVYETDPPRPLTSAPEPPAASAPETAARPSPSPMLVEVDTDQTMSAVGGDGVGVFVEYARGGKWRIWWTCDTNRSRQSCEFALSASVSAGSIESVDRSGLEGATLSSQGSSRLDASSRTTTEVHSLSFATLPGAVLTVAASVGGLQDGSFLFFVQDGQVNGGFSGRLTNPLQLRGTSP